MRASGTRDSAVVGLVLLAVLGYVWAEADAFLDESPPEFSTAEARHFDLPDGRPQIAVSASDEDDILVRWQNPDGETWTQPKVAYRAGSRTLTDMRIQVGGPTLAVSATYTLPETYYVDALSAKGLVTDDVTVFVVCRDESCTASREYAGTPAEPPQVTPDGEHVLLAEIDRTAVTWSGAHFGEHETAAELTR